MSPSSPRPKGLLTRGLKLVGHLTGPETRTGRAFAKAERRLTEVTAKLGENPTWLRISGGLLRGGFNMRIRRHALQERLLHGLRMPAASEVEAMRDQVRRLNHQVEALGSQLELVVDLLERKEHAAARPGESLSETPSRQPASRRHGT